jgi:Na+/H+ antiporter NhaC
MSSETPSRSSLAHRIVSVVVLVAIVALLVHVGRLAGRAEEAGEPEKIYNLWTTAPALVAIGLAIITRQVVISLAVGVLVAAFMLLPCWPADQTYEANNAAVAGARVAVETFLVGAMADPDHIKIMVFTLTIGAMVGIIGATGGTAALVHLVSRRARKRRAGQLVAWAAGLVVFFDDYANSMIVGPTMRPIFDRLKISREKLAYVVDSTAAPVASIALIGTWVGAEIGFIQSGLDDLSGALPAALGGVTAYESFLFSLPYRFYPIFALVLVMLVAATGRDFGPMARAEAAVPTNPPPDTPGQKQVPIRRWWLAGVPVLILISGTLAIIISTGVASLPKGQPFTFRTVLEQADPYASILYAAIGSAAVAALLGTLSRAVSLRQTMEAAMAGMAGMFPAIVVLVLAWSLSAATQALHLGEAVTASLQRAEVSAEWLPLLIFLAAAGVSFATGTSWGTMGILCPVVVTVSARLIADLPPEPALQLFYASVGSVLAGAIFGDHCSPISDTTVLSAAASGCSLEQHVWTQAPYAAVAALVAVVAGNLLCGVCGLPWWLAWVVGAGLLLLIVRGLGRPAGPVTSSLQASTKPGLRETAPD